MTTEIKEARALARKHGLDDGYMYMYPTKQGGYAFKHVETRAYLEVHPEMGILRPLIKFRS